MATTTKRVWMAVGVFLLIALAIVGYALFKNRAGGSDQAEFFADSTPAAGEALPASPVALVLNFTQDVAQVRSFEVTTGASAALTSEQIAEPAIDELPTTVRRLINQPLPDGDYRMSYDVCFADTTCGKGEIAFSIDGELLSQDTTFVDMRGKTEVLVELDKIQFNPQKVIVSPNTKVTWRNLEPLEHYVNTETHPYHTYVLDHNSRVLGEGSEFSYTFEAPGAYPYHCSAHAQVMTGMIVVAE